MDPLLQLETAARKKLDDGDYQEAILIYQELLAVVPNWEHGLGCYELGWSLEQQGEFKKALISYESAIWQRRHDAYFWFGYANLAASKGNPNKALELLLLLLEHKRSTSYADFHTAFIKACSRAGWTEFKLVEVLSKFDRDGAISTCIDSYKPETGRKAFRRLSSVQRLRKARMSELKTLFTIGMNQQWCRPRDQ